jgi:hydroxymethylglutaryl-CoA lyase
MGYPRVVLNEELMREGMQIESAEIPLSSKVELLNALSRTGLKHIVVGSFVSRRYTPQMADIDELVSSFTPQPGVSYTALALNEHGRERVQAHTPPLSASDMPPTTYAHLCDTFARRNTNSAQADEIARWPLVLERAVAGGAPRAGIGVGAAWGSNFEGPFSHQQRMQLLERQSELWGETAVPVTWVTLTDPMSWCRPDEVEEDLLAIRDRWPAVRDVHLHLHDARGMALPCIWSALRVLDENTTLHLDVTAGGIGGCPYCGNGRATGMAATEDVVHLLDSLGVETGVDLERLIEVVWLLERALGRPTPGHVSKAGPRPGPDDLYDPNLPFVETHEQARHFRLGPAVVADGIRPWREPIPQPVFRPISQPNPRSVPTANPV